jgi:hypothetical protein
LNTWQFARFQKGRNRNIGAYNIAIICYGCRRISSEDPYSRLKVEKKREERKNNNIWRASLLTCLITPSAAESMLELEEYHTSVAASPDSEVGYVITVAQLAHPSVVARQRNTKDVNDLKVGEFHSNFCLESALHSSAYNNTTSIMVCCHAGGGCC